MGLLLVTALVAVLFIALKPRRMEHLYESEEGHLVAANTLVQAARCLGRCSCLGLTRVPDSKLVTLYHEDTDEEEIKAACEWAADHTQPAVVAEEED